MTKENIFDRELREAQENPDRQPRPVSYKPEEISETLRYALMNDERSVYEIAKALKIEPDSLYRFKQGFDIRLETADKLAAYLGFELKAIKRKRKATR